MSEYCLGCQKKIWFFQKKKLKPYYQIIRGKEAFRVMHGKCAKRDVHNIGDKRNE